MSKKNLEGIILGLLYLVLPMQGLAETIECHGRKKLQTEGPLDAVKAVVKNDTYFDSMVVEISSDDVRYTESGPRGNTVYLASVEGRSEDGKILKIALNAIETDKGKITPFYSEVVSYLLIDLHGLRAERVDLIPFKGTFYAQFGDCSAE